MTCNRTIKIVRQLGVVLALLGLGGCCSVTCGPEHRRCFTWGLFPHRYHVAPGNGRWFNGAYYGHHPTCWRVWPEPCMVGPTPHVPGAEIAPHEVDGIEMRIREIEPPAAAADALDLDAEPPASPPAPAAPQTEPPASTAEPPKPDPPTPTPAARPSEPPTEPPSSTAEPPEPDTPTLAPAAESSEASIEPAASVATLVVKTTHKVAPVLKLLVGDDPPRP